MVTQDTSAVNVYFGLMDVYTAKKAHITINVKLITPIAMEEGLRFAIREGGRTVGAGAVAKIIE